MAGKFLHIEDAEPMSFQDSLQRKQGIIEKVFVVYGIELNFLDKLEQVRDLAVRTPVSFNNIFMPAITPLMSGTWASTLLAIMKSADRSRARSSRAVSTPKKRTYGARRSARGFSHVLGWIDAQHRDAERQEMLEEIAVIAGDLDHLACRTQMEPFAGDVDVTARLVEPSLSNRRREICILRENVLRVQVRIMLDEQAIGTDLGVQRIFRLLPRGFR